MLRAEKNGVRRVSLGCLSEKHTKKEKKKTNLLKFIGASTSGAEVKRHLYATTLLFLKDCFRL